MLSIAIVFTLLGVEVEDVYVNAGIFITDPSVPVFVFVIAAPTHIFLVIPTPPTILTDPVLTEVATAVAVVVKIPVEPIVNLLFAFVEKFIVFVVDEYIPVLVEPVNEYVGAPTAPTGPIIGNVDVSCVVDSVSLVVPFVPNTTLPTVPVAVPD
jgi:hypothetical protein